jgi:hypothetical protein
MSDRDMDLEFAVIGLFELIHTLGIIDKNTAVACAIALIERYSDVYPHRSP